MADNNGKTGIKSWSEEDRPREKLMVKGPQALSDAELLAIFIRTGTKEKNALELSRQILSENDDDLDILAKMSIAKLKNIKGIGEAKAVTIIAALELGRRRKESLPAQKNKLSSSKMVYDYFFHLMADKAEENFYVLLLNRANQPIIKPVLVSLGGVAGTTVDPKIIFKHAIENLASGIILCHNHPSGNLQPSSADIALTQNIKESGLLLDIKLLDHLIVTNSGYYSFADEGLL